jgi:hypothetical protein
VRLIFFFFFFFVKHKKVLMMQYLIAPDVDPLLVVFIGPTSPLRDVNKPRCLKYLELDSGKNLFMKQVKLKPKFRVDY